jgi:uncharacterized protein YigA (DUF484 family)
MTDLMTNEALEKQVVEYLHAHPDFFEHHPNTLLQLSLTDSKKSPKTSSLLERQLDLAKKRLIDSEKKLSALIDNGKANETLSNHVNRLAVSLLKTHRVNDVLTATEQRLKNDFRSEQLLWLVDESLGSQCEPMHSLRVLHKGDALFESIELIIKSGKPRIGRLRGKQREQLLPLLTHPAESAALIPLICHSSSHILVIGSENPDHFDPSMSTDFLEKIAQLISAALERAMQV